MSRPIPSITGIVRSARKMPPMPSVSPIVWRRPWRAGISKSVSVAAWPPTWIMLIAKSAPSSASRRSSVRRDRRAWRRAARRSSAPSPRPSRAARASMSCSATSMSPELREAEQVAQQVARELDAAGSDEGDAGHLGGSMPDRSSRCTSLRRFVAIEQIHASLRRSAATTSFHLCANSRAPGGTAALLAVASAAGMVTRGGHSHGSRSDARGRRGDPGGRVDELRRRGKGGRRHRSARPRAEPAVHPRADPGLAPRPQVGRDGRRHRARRPRRRSAAGSRRRVSSSRAAGPTRQRVCVRRWPRRPELGATGRSRRVSAPANCGWVGRR